ncbi:MAG: hypothetical protein U1A27_04310 [Phycisphaerae bacterium]
MRGQTRSPRRRLTGAALLLATVCARDALAAGPDIIVCDITSVGQFGRVGAAPDGTVGIAIGTLQSNKGDVPLNWQPLPATTHPLIGQNLYRVTVVDGATRFEQIGQSWLMNSFCPLALSTCFACSGSGGPCDPHLWAGCSSSHTSNSQAETSNLSPRGKVNPFTGSYASDINSHLGHTHSAIAHRLEVADADLQTPGASYYIEAQIVTPDDAAAGNGTNNASYRPLAVGAVQPNGVYPLTLPSPAVAELPAIRAWSTAAQTDVDPLPGSDGRIIVACEVSPRPGGGWHYEYAIHNLNLAAAVGSFSVPVGACAAVTGVGFHAVANHAASEGSPSYANDPWSAVQTPSSISWATPETFAVNPNGNALRWGTLDNFRFDSDQPPVDVSATVGLFAVAGSALVTVKGPAAAPPVDGDVDGNCLANTGDVPPFVAVLLGLDGDAGRHARSDLNHDGSADGGDVQLFVTAIGL